MVGTLRFAHPTTRCSWVRESIEPQVVMAGLDPAKQAWMPG